MFHPAREGTYMTVVTWRTRDGRYTTAYPGKDNCETANIPDRRATPVSYALVIGFKGLYLLPFNQWIPPFFPCGRTILNK